MIQNFKKKLKTQLYFYMASSAVHTSPSRKQSFSKTFFKQKEFENAGRSLPRRRSEGFVTPYNSVTISQSECALYI